MSWEPGGRSLFHMSLAVAAPLLLCLPYVFLAARGFFSVDIFFHLVIWLLILACIAMAATLTAFAAAAAVQIIKARLREKRPNVKLYVYVLVLPVAIFAGFFLAWNLSPDIPGERHMQGIVDRVHAGEEFSFQERYDMRFDFGGIPGNQFVRFHSFFANRDYLYFDRAFYEEYHPELIRLMSFRMSDVVDYEHIRGNWYYITLGPARP